ncbi:hypothetical protein LEP1GSC062_0513 [Leptospira alexanderi serovar Manhao 3 str. L 60]|uniref:Uncharacterized protein n=1 Tax=Leptospira alexanderi serovar Manhao 3 str. L 60 TaxID=1049759 RepID=V6IG24_9LEPT|nr:hypothetical protein LEP1GSC062_0513 [Leptospira alexanderi serovar Manhao 3 str. L 60]
MKYRELRLRQSQKRITFIENFLSQSNCICKRTYEFLIRLQIDWIFATTSKKQLSKNDIQTISYLKNILE